MANRPAPTLVLRDGDRAQLERWMRSTTVEAGLARRARIVLLGAEGVSNEQAAALAGVSLPTVRQWRRRYLESGVAGLRGPAVAGRVVPALHRP